MFSAPSPTGCYISVVSPLSSLAGLASGRPLDELVWIPPLLGGPWLSLKAWVIEVVLTVLPWRCRLLKDPFGTTVDATAPAGLEVEA